MCLELTKKSKKLIAKSDIRCYKVARIFTQIDGVRAYMTPFQGSLIEIGKTYNSELSIERIGFLKYGIFRGIHCFMKAEDCFAFLSESYNLSMDYAVIECIIPKGSSYYRGYFREKNSFTSDCLTYVREISAIIKK